ncbi:hypothetical protein [Sorangium sp. So ce542]|uniref:hypothetical protein n=1 Tax=Sorangium sp. So ce542 TaxID=3133316 RepID=UPI003F5F95B0
MVEILGLDGRDLIAGEVDLSLPGEEMTLHEDRLALVGLEDGRAAIADGAVVPLSVTGCPCRVVRVRGLS